MPIFAGANGTALDHQRVFFPPRLMKGLSVGYLGFGSIGCRIHKMLMGSKLRVPP